MGLKDLQSIYDLVPGNNKPVGKMDEQQGPQFDLGPSSTLHQDSLPHVPGGAQSSPYQDLDGAKGPQFDNGITSTIHEDSLTQQYQYQYGNSPEVVDPSLLDLEGIQGPQFQKPTDMASQAHESSLALVPGGDNPSPYQDLDGIPGPQFDLGPDSILQQDSLLSVPGGDSNSPYQDMDGNSGPQFDKGSDSTFHEDSLAGKYQSAVTPLSSHGAGQPGGTWPSVKPPPLGNNFADLDGNLPSNGEYINNLPI